MSATLKKRANHPSSSTLNLLQLTNQEMCGFKNEASSELLCTVDRVKSMYHALCLLMFCLFLCGLVTFIAINHLWSRLSFSTRVNFSGTVSLFFLILKAIIIIIERYLVNLAVVITRVWNLLIYVCQLSNPTTKHLEVIESRLRCLGLWFSMGYGCLEVSMLRERWGMVQIYVP